MPIIYSGLCNKVQILQLVVQPNEKNSAENSSKSPISVLCNDNSCKKAGSATSMKDNCCKEAVSATSMKDNSCKKALSITSTKDNSCKKAGSATSMKDNCCKEAASATSMKDNSCKKAGSAKSINDNSCKVPKKERTTSSGLVKDMLSAMPPAKRSEEPTFSSNKSKNPSALPETRLHIDSYPKELNPFNSKSSIASGINYCTFFVD